MNVVGMEPRAAQPHRPAPVEAPAAAVAAAQGIGGVADVLEVAANGRGKGAEQRADRRVGTAREILRGLCAVAQGLKQQRVAMRVVQAVETDPEVSKKT